jgi:2,4-dienoyl-CoA reductase-like NADH-dependent reductase (Old Yellow Enzyme family)
MSDGVRGGLTVPDSIEAARLLQAEDVLAALELTAGGSRANQMYMFRGDPPRAEMAAALPGVAGIGFRLAGRALLRDYPYQDGYLLPLARQFRAALTLPLILLGGITSLAAIRQAMDEGFDFVAMGRALLREPDLVARLAAGQTAAGTCTHCNKCIPSIFTGTRCVLDNPARLNIA